MALIDADAPLGSPGNHYTAATVKAYDPTGLRSAMTATHAEMYKSIQSHMPNHNVSYAWEDQIEVRDTTCVSLRLNIQGIFFRGLKKIHGASLPKSTSLPVPLAFEPPVD